MSTIRVPVLDDDGNPTGVFEDRPLVLPSDIEPPTEDELDDDFDIATAGELPTVGELLSSPENRARRQDHDAVLDKAADRLSQSLGSSWHVKDLDGKCRTCGGSCTFHPMPDNKWQEYVKRDREQWVGGPQEPSTDLSWIERPRSLWAEVAAGNYDAEIRRIDLRNIEGKSHAEVSEVVRNYHQNHVHVDFNTPTGKFVNSSEVANELAQELRRGMVLGATLAAGAFAALVAWDWARR